MDIPLITLRCEGTSPRPRKQAAGRKNATELKICKSNKINNIYMFSYAF